MKLPIRRVVAPGGEGRCSILCRHRHACSGEEGFSLIELVMVLIIMPLVVGAIAVVMITTLKATAPGDIHGTANRLAESHDAQITSTYFVRDVQNSTQITTAGLQLCGSNQTQVLGLVGDGGATAISYVLTMVGGTPVFVRNYCASGPSSSPTNTSTMSHTLKSSSSVVLEPLTCNASFDGTCGPDASAGLVSSLDVAQVQVDVTEASGWVFTLLASPRQVLGSTLGVVSSAPPLVLLGSAGSSAGAVCNVGREGLSVNGVLAVNSATAGSVKIGSGGLTAQQVYSEPISGGGRPVTPAGRYRQQGAPVGTSQYTTGPALSDPYSALPVPSPSGANTFVYSQQLTVGNDPANGNLKSGVYILEAGINAPSLKSDPGGVFLYVTGGSVVLGGGPGLSLSAITASSSPYGGVLLYQVPFDPNAVTLAGTPSVNALDGVIDASGVPVSLGGGATVSALGLVAASLSCQLATSGSFGPQATTTTVTSSQNPSLQGQQVTFTATVNAAGGLAVSGSVAFAISATGGGTVSCDGGNSPALVAGQASCTTSALTNVGSPYTVTATYPGSLGYDGSNKSLSQQVQVPSSTSVTSSVNPSSSGQSVKFTATVTGTGPPSGSVTFNVTDKNNNPSDCTGFSNTVPLVGGSATCTMGAGTLLSTNSPFTVAASYSGDTNNAKSAGSLTGTQVVGVAATTTVVTALPQSPSPPNLPVLFTATVSGAGGGSGMTGTVIFAITNAQGAAVNCVGGNTKNLFAARASCVVPPLAASGSPYKVSAMYGGDANFLTSTGLLTQAVS